MFLYRILQLCILATALNHIFGQETLRKMTLKIEDLNSNFEIKRVWNIEENDNIIHLTLKTYHAYLFSGGLNFYASNWTWNLHPEELILKGPRAFFHFRSDINRNLTIGIRSQTEDIFLKLFLKFNKLKYLNCYVDKMAIDHGGPINQKNVSFRLYLYSKNHRLLTMAKSKLKISVVFQQSLEEDQIPWWHCLILSSRNGNGPSCYEVNTEHVTTFENELSFRKKFTGFKYYCVWKFYYVFASIGWVNIFTTVEVKHRAAFVETQVCVFDEQCALPKIEKTRGKYDEEMKLHFLFHENITLTGNVVTNDCFLLNNATLTWHLIPKKHWQHQSMKITNTLLRKIDVIDYRREVINWLNKTVRAQYPINYINVGRYVIALALYSETHCAPEGVLFYNSVEVEITSYLDDSHRKSEKEIHQKSLNQEENALILLKKNKNLNLTEDKRLGDKKDDSSDLEEKEETYQLDSDYDENSLNENVIQKYQHLAEEENFIEGEQNENDQQYFHQDFEEEKVNDHHYDNDDDAFSLEPHIRKPFEVRGKGSLSMAHQISGTNTSQPGHCQVLPPVGIALQTLFQIKCFNMIPNGDNPVITIFQRYAVDTLNESVSAKLETFSDVIYQSGSFPLEEPTTIKDLHLPVGDKKRSYRLPLQVISKTDQGNSGFAVAEVIVVPPRRGRAVHLVEKIIGEISTSADSDQLHGTVRLTTSITSVLKEASLGQISLDFSITILDLLDQIVASDPETAVLISAAAVRLSEVFQSIPATVSHTENLVSSITNLLGDFEKALGTLRAGGDEEFRLSTLSANCLQLIANAAQLLSKTTREKSSKSELALIKLREHFLETLSQSRVNATSKSCDADANECLEFGNASPSGVEITGGANSGGATVTNADKSDFVAVSTFDFNPFPDLPNATEQLDEESDQEYLGINTPVVGISSVTTSNTTAGAKPSIAPSFDVIIPLKLTKDNNGTILYLPPLCVPPMSFKKGNIINTSLVNRVCGLISMKLDVSSIIVASFDPTQTVQKTSLDVTIGYMIVKSKVKCRFVDKPCIQVLFVNAQRPPSCAISNDTCITGFSIVHSVSLPRPLTNQNTDNEDPFSIPLSEQFVKTFATSDRHAFILLKDLQPDPLTQLRVGSAKFRQVTVIVLRTECYSWDIGANVWTGKFCENPRILLGLRLACFCSTPVDDDGYYSLSVSRIPRLFGAKLIAVPRYINFGHLSFLLAQFDERWHIIPIVVAVWIIFLPLLAWSRWRDKQDEHFSPFIIPPDSDPRSKFLYEVVVFTSVFRNAGTTANVTIVLEGETGTQSEPHVISNLTRQLLQRGAVDSFLISSRNGLGKVTKVILWHDNTGPSPNWHLGRVAVYDLQAQDKEGNSFFLAYQWLALDVHPYCCHVLLNQATLKELTSERTIWRINVANVVKHVYVWSAIFHKTTGSTFTRTQRTACCMVLVYGSMLASITFYGLSKKIKYDFYIGNVPISYVALIVGLETAVLMTPITFFINLAFRCVKPSGVVSAIEEPDNKKFDTSLGVENNAKGQALYPSGANERYSNLNEHIEAASTNLDISRSTKFFDTYLNDKSYLQTFYPSGLNDNDDSRRTRETEYYDVLEEKKYSKNPFHKRRRGLAIKRSVHQLRFPIQTGYYLPSQFVWVGWLLVLTHLACTSAFTIIYGFQLGRAATFDWFVTFLSSVIQNSFFIAPLRLVATATLNLYYKKGKFLLSDWLGIPGNWGRQKAIANWRCLQAQHGYDWFHIQILSIPSFQNETVMNQRLAELNRTPWCYKPPNFRSLLQAGKFKIAVAQVQQFWKEALIWLLLTVLITTILLLHRDSRIYRLNTLYKDHFVNDFQQIRNMEDVFDYMESTFLPRVYQDTPDTVNGTMFLLGAVRIRQARLNYIACTKSPSKILQQKNCIPEERTVTNFYQFDVGNYQPFWEPLLEKEDFSHIFNEAGPSVEILSSWMYSELSQTFFSRPLVGNSLRRPYYPPGGYAVDLRFNRETMQATLSGLKVTKWIDGKTSAIFINAAFYSMHSQHISSLFLAVETGAHGGTSKYYEIHTFKPPYFYTFNDLALAIMQIFHFLADIYLFIDLIKQCREIKWQKRGVYQILFNTWNVFAIFSAVLSFAAYFIYIAFIHYSVTTIKNHKEDTSRYTSFATPGRMEYYFTVTLSFAAFLSCMRVLKAFRCSSTITVMIDAIGCCKGDIFNVTLIVAITLMAFSSFWYVAFGFLSFPLRGFKPAFLSAYALMVGVEVDTSESEDSQTSENNLLIKEPLFGITFCIFVFFAVALLINMYTTTVENGYKKIKVHLAERSWDPVETLAVVWLFDKILDAIGITKVKLEFLKPRSVNPASSRLTLHSSDEDEIKNTGTFKKEIKATRKTVKKNVAHSVQYKRMTKCIHGEKAKHVFKHPH